MLTKQVNVGVLTAFINILGTEQFSRAHDINSARMSSILSWVHKLDTDDAKHIRQAMEAKHATRTKLHAFRSLFKEGPPALRELGTEQTKQVLKAAVAIIMLAGTDKRVLELYHLLFPTGKLAGSLLIGTIYVPSKCNTYLISKGSCFQCKVPTRFEVLLYFHSLMYCVRLTPTGRKYKNKFRKRNHSANRVGFAVSLLVSAWSHLANHLKIPTFEDMVLPYIIWKEQTCQFSVLSNREDGFAPKSQSESFEGISEAVYDVGSADETAFRRSRHFDTALRHITTLFFTCLHELVSHDYLYECREDHSWSFLDKYRSTKGSMPPLFGMLPEEIKSALAYELPRTEVYDVDDPTTIEEIVDPQGQPKQKHWEQFQPRVLPRKRKRGEVETSKVHSLTLGARVLKGEDMFHEKEVFLDTVSDNAGTSNTRKVPSSPAVREKAEIQELFRRLLPQIHPYCRLHDVSLSELIETDANEAGFALEGKVQLIAADPPYNTRRNRGAPNSSHDTLTDEVMAECILLFDLLLKPGGHGVVFCSALQFHKWHSLLICHRRARQGVDETEPSQPRATTFQTVFNVEEVPLTFVRAPGHYFQNPAQKTLSHLSVVETAIHFWKRGLTFKEEIKAVSYRNQGYVPSRHSARTNCMDNIPRIMGQERVVFRGERNVDHLLRPEQKCVAMMKEIISHYTKPGDIVVDPFAGTCSTGKACMLLKEHRYFVGCDSDEVCVQNALPPLLQTFAQQILNPSSDINVSHNFHEVAKRYLALNNTLSSYVVRRASKWNVPPGLPSYQRLLIHIHRYLSCQLGSQELALEYRHSPPDVWPLQYKAFLDTMNPNDLLALEAATKGFIVSKSTVRHPFAGRGVFTTRCYKKGEDLMTYYGTLVYENLDLQNATTKVYGSGILGVRKTRFCATALELRTKVFDSKNVRHPIFIVPAPFCLAGHINDPRYLDEDEDANERSTERARTPNVHFVETCVLPTKENLRSNKLIVVKPTREITAGEELFVDYGSHFQYWSSFPQS